MPAALTAIRTSPAPTDGSGRSCTCSTSGPPFPVCTSAFTGSAYLTGRGLQIDRATDRKAIQLEDLGDRRLVHRRVSRQSHHRTFAILLGANRGGDDVDALLSEHRADPADHAGTIGVAEDRDVLGEGQVEALAPD